MKIMVAADIHGSAFYCKQLLELYEKEKCEKLLLLGDVLYHGPRNDLPKQYEPKSVISMLNTYKDDILCVRGNCDCEVDQMVLEFPVLAEYAYLLLGTTEIFATHGHVFNKDKLPPIKPGTILLHGHTHVPVCEKLGEIIYMNPGSVSIPKEGSHHGCIIVERFRWKMCKGI